MSGKVETFVEGWTTAFLRENADPKPRTKGYMLDDRLAKLTSGKRGAKGVPKLRTENDLNFNLSLKIYRQIHEQAKGIRSVTFELPLAKESDGQLKADMVVFDAGGLVEIIELKQENGSDSPLMALVEAICYTIQLLRAWKDLQSELPLKPSFQPHTVNMVLAAPEKYWANCRGKQKAIDFEQMESLGAIVKTVQSELKKQTKLPSPNLLLTFADVIDEGRGGLRVRAPGLDESLQGISVVSPLA
jgi:hypothetical protein